tara:strand:- start:1848 stop:3668 length:1821 start_codon:yes stop_codon:yes gene_type:complete
MCGIFGVFGTNSVVDDIIEGLSRLEYRGYDSSGLAVYNEQKLQSLRAEGKLINLKEILQKNKIDGKIGIGHTRWATHGIPSEINAHPHVTEKVALVHNGIIENFDSLKKTLTNKGYNFKSQTDSEVIANLITDFLNRGFGPLESIKKTLPKLKGSFAIAVLFSNYNVLIGARKGSPLAFGIKDKKIFLGSDSLALAPFTQNVCFLEEGDIVYIEDQSYFVIDKHYKKVERKISIISNSGSDIGKGNFNHYMQKEIFEQPSVISNSLSRFIDPFKKKMNIPDLSLDWSNIKKINMIACGTSYYACLTATYWMQKYLKVDCAAELASEYRYKELISGNDHILVFISQSGETADTLAALRYAKSKKLKTVAIVNVAESSMAREADICLPISAGPEIGVASTKALTAQLMLLACMTLVISRLKKTISKKIEEKLTRSLIELPSKMSEILNSTEQIKSISSEIVNSKSALFLGRGSCYPIALEGALKLKEISYIHAEGYASGEMKHGPIALIDELMPVIIISPTDDLFEKNISNTQEILARGGKVILLTDRKGEKKIHDLDVKKIILPDAHNFVIPIMYCVPVQLLAYYVAVSKGTDVDQPRNLAKSVTVE